MCEEYTHAKHLAFILEHKGIAVPDMSADWEKAKTALNI